MDNLDLNSVNAESVVNVEPQETTVTEPVNAGSEEVATPQTDSKPQQSTEQNAEYARIRREAEAKAKDQTIAEMYGESHGIYTYADYQKAIAEQKAAEEMERIKEQIGVDPDTLKPVFEAWKKNDPDFQELSQIRAEKNINESLTNLNNELKDAGIDLQLKDLSVEEYMKIPNADKVTEYVQKGHSLADAFFLANKKDIISKKSQAVEQETIKKIIANGTSSPGPLANNGDSITQNGVWNMSNADFKAMQERALRGELKRT